MDTIKGHYIVELLDEVDEAVFSGDSLHDDALRSEIKASAKRWLRAIAEHEGGDKWRPLNKF